MSQSCPESLFYAFAETVVEAMKTEGPQSFRFSRSNGSRVLGSCRAPGGFDGPLR